MLNRPLNPHDTFDSVMAAGGVTLDAILAMSPNDPLAPYVGSGNVCHYGENECTCDKPTADMTAERLRFPGVQFCTHYMESRRWQRPLEDSCLSARMAWLIAFAKMRWSAYPVPGGDRSYDDKRWAFRTWLPKHLAMTNLFFGMDDPYVAEPLQILRQACGLDPIPASMAVSKPQRKKPPSTNLTA